jgi:hypothetical protein
MPVSVYRTGRERIQDESPLRTIAEVSNCGNDAVPEPSIDGRPEFNRDLRW